MPRRIRRREASLPPDIAGPSDDRAYEPGPPAYRVGPPHRVRTDIPFGPPYRLRSDDPSVPTTSPRPSPRLPDVDDDLADADTVVIVPGHRRARNLGSALLITLGAAVLPGSGHLVLRRRTGWAILASFLLLCAGAAVFVTKVPRARLIEYLLRPDLLGVVILGCFLSAVLWLAVVLRTYDLAKPRRLSTGKQIAGSCVVFVLCLAVSAPFALAGYAANAQRNLLDALFPTDSADGSKAPAGDVNAIKKPRLNILLLGSDAGEGRIGTRTDTMVVASIDTRTARTILFSLARNTAYAQFPPSSRAAQQFPNGFHKAGEPSGNYLLNAVYSYGNEYPAIAPSTPSRDPGLNLLMSSISYLLGVELDYYIKIDMAGFASLVDALGGLDVNVGPTQVPMGGIGPFGETVKPFGWIPAGQQHLNGQQALWFARSRTNSTDYVRMGRQRCLLQYLVDQKTPVDVLKNFQSVAAATKDSLSTNIPQGVLPALVTLAGKAKSHPLESVSFDPNLPDPEQPDGRFNTGDPNFPLMRQVVRDIIKASSGTTSTPPTTARSTAPPTAPPTAPRTAPSAGKAATPGRGTTPSTGNPSTEPPQPVSLEETCNGAATE
ncbi:MAG TPA: LCP family protein [Pseudonocardiaceae bacterium]